MPGPKIHRIAAAEPLQDKQDRIAACGLVIPKATWVFIWNSETNGIAGVVTNLNACRVCEKLDPKDRYVYGVICGQESEQPWDAA